MLAAPPHFQPFTQLPEICDRADSANRNFADGIVIVGAGLAGLFAALKLSESSRWPIILLSPLPLGDNNASSWAQGGIAAAVGPDDSAQLHAQDTLAAGAGLNDSEVVQAICEAAAAHIHQLDAYGVPFDRQEAFSGVGPPEPGKGRSYSLSREAAHSVKRVVRCSGDSSGRLIMACLVAAAKRREQIAIIEGAIAEQLIPAKSGNGIRGVIYRREEKVYQLAARAVVLACGGIGALFAATTNPPSVQGHGLGMAAVAGAVLADSEFVQFHPTALDLAESPQPLASEALRGEGAILRDANGRRFMRQDLAARHYERPELAPRDIVARAVFRARRDSGGAFLDCRKLCQGSEEFSQRFPTLWESTQRHGLDPQQNLLPVIPAAHYHMGGIATDLRGRSSVSGLWAIGEVACTGLHGANRLASNSLLEAVVMAGNAAADMLAILGNAPQTSQMPLPQVIGTQTNISAAVTEFPLRQLMSQYVGVERDSSGLLHAVHELLTHCPAELQNPSQARFEPAGAAVSNAVVAALCISCAAILRRESRGSHYFQPASPPPVLGAALQELLKHYDTSGRRSFLDWPSICRILNALD